MKNVENDCKTTSYNDDDSPPGGRGQPCIFPFMVYDEEENQNRTFDKCTTEFCGNYCSNGNVWCSTQVDEDGFHTEGLGNWGYCSKECLPDTKSDFVIRDNFDIVESTIGSQITETTTATAKSTERPLIEQSSKESASIEIAIDMEMPQKPAQAFSTKFPPSPKANSESSVPFKIQ